jgi:two-component system OmpR family sensor kinase
MAMAGRTGGVWERLRAVSGRTPLRVKLITVVLGLVAMALAVISIAGISVLKNYLLTQADQTLASYANNAGHYTRDYVQGASTAQSEQGYVIWIPSGGKPQMVVEQVGGFHPDNGFPAQPQTLPAPQVPASAAWLAANSGRYVTVPAQVGSVRWRVLVEPGTFGTPSGAFVSGSVVMAVNVTSVYNAIGQLTALDLIVSALLLLVILVVGIAVIRASLRPLTDIEKTAGAIAAGDLTRRVPDADPRTEVGRLGGSLNVMLSQIEAAFDARAQSEFAARRSEERMRQFVADASHELRTPLTAIRGFAEYYRQRGGTAELAGGAAGLGGGPAELAGGATGQRALANGTDHSGPGADPAEAGTAPSPRHASHADPDRTGPLTRAELDRIMRRVEQESSRMGVLVEDMLLLARLDQQRPLEQHTVDMLTLAADAVHDARVVAPDRSINLTVGAGAALLVIGDEVRLRQVIGNLMSNALNHTPDGTGIEVRVRLGSLDEWRAAAAAAAAATTPGRPAVAVAVAVPDVQPFPAVVFEIADQGAGLTPAQAEHVFERFYRADQARTRPGGTGLGLAIVAALVAAHGGTVWAESLPGNGAIFRIAVPLAPEARNTAPEFDDGTDPDILNSHRPLMPQPEVPPEAAYPEPPPRPGRHGSGGGTGPAGPGGSAAAAPLPKRRPGFSGHIRT